MKMKSIELMPKFIQDGVIGKVKEVHTFSNKTWGDPSAKPDRVDPVPAGFNGDLWLGIAAERPFIGGGYYHPGNWRKRKRRSLAKLAGIVMFSTPRWMRSRSDSHRVTGSSPSRAWTSCSSTISWPYHR